ncbi:nucleotidyltransferase family protein [Halogeometricum sp. S1BR25-6]|uniref:Nucleotidyltransferase family protein n=1 Tax=Halogeometricum salsisoli TaxID=2950536 RepID=A0ABU2GHE0_9EURY|nr:nucleotidyltransferase family protein [Halogeometricum sp. S1BR25-6]MDS0300236.1 nucleotidyltransferase family protein [Halogeometricum sp. S1BR25-6]
MTMPGSPAGKILFYIVQSAGGSDNADKHIHKIACEDPDWERILPLAASHGLTSHLRESIKPVQSKIPEKVYQSLESQYRMNGVKNLQHTEELHSVLEAFKESGIQAIPYKGPVLSEFAYGDLNARWFKDLDVLVRQQDLARAREILREAGYEQTNAREIPLQKLVDESFFRWERELRFENENENIQIELRPQFTGGNASNARVVTDLWKRRTPLTVGGRTLQALSPEDRALLLLTHGSKHGWARLSWVCDIAALFHRDIEWETVLTRAEGYGWKTAVLFGLSVTAELAKVEIPEKVKEEVQNCRRATIGTSIASRLFQYDPTGESLDLEPWTVVFFLNDTLRGSFKELIDVLFAPRKVDVKFFPLPPKLYPLYYLIRPFKLIPKLLKKLKR